MPDVHTKVQPIDGSNNAVVLNNPDNSASANQPSNPADVPAPSKTGSQVTVKASGTSGVVTHFSNPAIVIF